MGLTWQCGPAKPSPARPSLAVKATTAANTEERREAAGTCPLSHKEEREREKEREEERKGERKEKEEAELGWNV